MSADDLSIAMLLEAARRSDPVARFLESLSDELREHAETTLRMRDELTSNVQRLMQCSDPREAAGYAEAIRRDVHEVAYRWTSFRRALERWAALEVRPLSFVVPR